MEYVEYLVWAMFAVGGFGVGRFARRRKVGRSVAMGSIGSVVGAGIAFAKGAAPDVPFRVVTQAGDVRYEGAEGGKARRHIEALRLERIEWRAYRDGRVWDWGPRG